MSTIAVDNARPSAGGTSYSLTSGVAKAWVNFNGTGTIAIRDSYNVGSITDNGSAYYTINISNAFSGSNYNFTGMSQQDVTTQGSGVMGDITLSPTTTSLSVRTARYTGFIDMPTVCVEQNGDLA